MRLLLSNSGQRFVWTWRQTSERFLRSWRHFFFCDMVTQDLADLSPGTVRNSGCSNHRMTVLMSFSGSIFLSICLSVRLRGCDHVCLKFLRLRAEHCTKWQPHQRERAGIKGRFMALPFKRAVWGVQSTHTGRGRLRMESSAQNQTRGRRRERKKEEHKRWREGKPQTPFDISHQRAVRTCLVAGLTLNLWQEAVGSPQQTHIRPSWVFDRSHPFACVFLGHTPSSHMLGKSSEDRKCPLFDLQRGMDGRLKWEQWSMPMDRPFERS